MKYNFETGTIVEQNSVIQLDQGEIVHIKTASVEAALLPHDRVIAAWMSPEKYPRKFRGKAFVDSKAVEKIDRWKRDSAYVRMYLKDNDADPFIAEKMVLERFRALGIRAEPATDFEDEMLGVDVWILLRTQGTFWKWYPVNVTLRKDMSPFQDGSKYDAAFRMGIIAVNLDFRLERNAPPRDTVRRVFESLQKACDDFSLCGKIFLSRETAMLREVSDIR